ncbi:nitrate reductase cytochrome c-type subunit [Inmirania thermothiophila]|uniref:Periplasmic nitrate reductase, electron transfer subunit n=1 Tax=Inmirania thermothiophila TaxID=1750597 RepID=A0A3N1XZL5_9GAMM|nr:nitrate reductase cytochrome c-type subunit [Inmirania thermothiophila]ROR32044.1 periplasmic nitrate reductase subunit NapB [Inmirania thermothiophila]
MNKVMRIGLVIVAAGAVWLPRADAESAGIHSLRGEHAVEETTPPPELKQYVKDRAPYARDYMTQPPLIPHSIQGYRIDLKFNKCLTCHSWANARESGATKISITHFKDREGNDLANVAPRRYFCTQCHVPQVNAPPLVENEFKPLPTIRR